jgi:hypothetical protein
VLDRAPEILEDALVFSVLGGSLPGINRDAGQVRQLAAGYCRTDGAREGDRLRHRRGLADHHGATIAGTDSVRDARVITGRE